MAAQRGLPSSRSEDPTVFSPTSLKRFSAIVLLSCTTDPKKPESEWLVGDRRDALQQFVRNGGGIVAIHAAADSHYNWPWYGRLIGGHFARHPAGTPKGQVTVVAPVGSRRSGSSAHGRAVPTNGIISTIMTLFRRCW